MNNCYLFLENLKQGASEEMFATDFLLNLKRFKYMIDEISLGVSSMLIDFYKSVPDHILDLSKQKNCLNDLFVNADEDVNTKIFLIEPLEQEEMGVKIEFDMTGKIVSIKFFNDRMQLILNAKSELVRLDLNGRSYQMLQLFKNYFTLNKRVKGSVEFKHIATYEQEDIDNKMKFQTYLLG